MMTIELTLSEKEDQAIRTITQATGKTVNQVLHQALEQLIAQVQAQPQPRRNLLRQARGIWKNSVDLPNFEDVRKEFDRL